MPSATASFYERRQQASAQRDAAATSAAAANAANAAAASVAGWHLSSALRADAARDRSASQRV